MKQALFYRNVRARDLLDLFFISAIASLLVTRFYLYMTGYPQIAFGGLHIGHMLWGGLLMLVGTTLLLAFLGIRMQRVAAIASGVGFGLFIDEIGKFITSDNNYFYRPSVGIIYAIFVIIYLTFNFLSREQKLSSREYQLNAMMQLDEAIVRDMDPLEKQRAQQLLARARKSDPITERLKMLLDSVDLVPANAPGYFQRLKLKLDQMYANFWGMQRTRRLVRLFFIGEALLFVALILGNIYNNLDEVAELLGGQSSYGPWLLVGQLVSSTAAAFFVMLGAYRLTNSRVEAFEQFRKATLINLFLTEFFIFSRIEFAALPGFAANVVILLLVTYVLQQEQRYDSQQEPRLVPHVAQSMQNS